MDDSALKLSHREEDELSVQLLEMEEKCFLIQEIEIHGNQNFEKSAISKCSGCGELIPDCLTIRKDNRTYCKACEGIAYYKLLQDA